MNDEKIEQKDIEIIRNIITILNKNINIKRSNFLFEEKINLYGIINYSRNQFFTRLSSIITANKRYDDIFFNYTSIESMILDVFKVIESDTLLSLDASINEPIDDKSYDKLSVLIPFSIKILGLLLEILDSKINLDSTVYESLNKEYTSKLFDYQNEFYSIVYDEKIDSRVD